MSYITTSRNVIKFQIESSEEYGYLKPPFRHSILFILTRNLELEKCLSYAFSKVAKPTVVVDNYVPFREWQGRTDLEDDSDESDGMDQRIDKYNGREYYLVPEIMSVKCCSLVNDSLNLMEFVEDWLKNLRFKNVDCFNSMYKSIWRRLYANNKTYFCSSDIDIAAFLKEQRIKNKPINVFNEIFKRERGETFNQRGILESIASPYYYALPHQKEENDERLNRYRTYYHQFLLDGFSIWKGPFIFYCSLIAEEFN
ncbi:uncharacterized protein TNCT_449581 [Trichonephila clavata]|uniref:Uncharacterized protein n=1 Tax=Trichonephila clavata TaxID=2740835 RepID=A0A8X6J964_TRICU|nr:uncharacterized protein TNCT_449581 [Trichonephila clavata]